MTANKDAPLLSVTDLRKWFPIRKGFFSRQTGTVCAVNGVSFELKRNASLGLVGESGSGKTTVGKCLLRLIEPTSGTVRFDGSNVGELTDTQLRRKRRDMQMIFQDPYSSLDPLLTVSQTIGEALTIHNLSQGADRHAHIEKLLRRVGLGPGDMNRYPHQFSGGQRQRIGIARALALNPKLLVADEPVSALDVSIQAQVINLMMRLKKQFDLTFIIISHDLAVVQHMCDTVAVMYLGHIVEHASRDTFYAKPHHPYAQSLLSAVPKPDPDNKIRRIVLQGEIPNPADPPPGCPFHPRCSVKLGICERQAPRLEERAPSHWVACHRENGA